MYSRYTKRRSPQRAANRMSRKNIIFFARYDCHNLSRANVGAVNLNLNARRRPNADSHRLLIVAFKSRQIAYGKDSKNKLAITLSLQITCAIHIESITLYLLFMPMSTFQFKNEIFSSF